jgi:cell division septation protein DedD
MSKLNFKFLIFLIIFVFKINCSYAFSFYAVQVGAFKEEEGAKTLLKEFIDKNYSAYVVSLNDGFYRVWLGKKLTKRKANILAKNLKNNGFDAIVKRIPKSYKKVKIEIKEEKKETEIKEDSKIKVEIKKEIEIKENSKISVATFEDKKSAIDLRDKLIEKGYFSYILVNKEENPILYYVCVGTKDNEKTKELFQRLKKEGFNVNFID